MTSEKIVDKMSTTVKSFTLCLDDQNSDLSSSHQEMLEEENRLIETLEHITEESSMNFVVNDCENLKQKQKSSRSELTHDTRKEDPCIDLKGQGKSETDKQNSSNTVVMEEESSYTFETTNSDAGTRLDSRAEGDSAQNCLKNQDPDVKEAVGQEASESETSPVVEEDERDTGEESGGNWTSEKDDSPRSVNDEGSDGSEPGEQNSLKKEDNSCSTIYRSPNNRRYFEDERFKVEKLGNHRLRVNGNEVIIRNYETYVSESDIDIPKDEDNRKTSIHISKLLACKQDHCCLGCLCDSINRGQQPRDHCTKLKCMLDCVCEGFKNGDIRSRLRPRSLLVWDLNNGTSYGSHSNYKDQNVFKDLESGDFFRIKRAALPPHRLRDAFISDSKLKKLILGESNKGKSQKDKIKSIKGKIIDAELKRAKILQRAESGRQSTRMLPNQPFTKCFRQKMKRKAVKGTADSDLSSAKKTRICSKERIQKLMEIIQRKVMPSRNTLYFKRGSDRNYVKDPPEIIQRVCEELQILQLRTGRIVMFAWTVEHIAPKVVFYPKQSNEDYLLPYLYVPIPKTGFKWVLHMLPKSLNDSPYLCFPSLGFMIASKALVLHLNEARLTKKTVRLDITWKEFLDGNNKKSRGLGHPCSLYLLPYISELVLIGPVAEGNCCYDMSSSEIIKVVDMCDRMSSKRFLGDPEAWEYFFSNAVSNAESFNHDFPVDNIDRSAEEVAPHVMESLIPHLIKTVPTPSRRVLNVPKAKLTWMDAKNLLERKSKQPRMNKINERPKNSHYNLRSRSVTPVEPEESSYQRNDQLNPSPSVINMDTDENNSEGKNRPGGDSTLEDMSVGVKGQNMKVTLEARLENFDRDSRSRLCSEKQNRLVPKAEEQKPQDSKIAQLEGKSIDVRKRKKIENHNALIEPSGSDGTRTFETDTLDALAPCNSNSSNVVDEPGDSKRRVARSLDVIRDHKQEKLPLLHSRVKNEGDSDSEPESEQDILQIMETISDQDLLEIMEKDSDYACNSSDEEESCLSVASGSHYNKFQDHQYDVDLGSTSMPESGYEDEEVEETDQGPEEVLMDAPSKEDSNVYLMIPDPSESDRACSNKPEPSMKTDYEENIRLTKESITSNTAGGDGDERKANMKNVTKHSEGVINSHSLKVEDGQLLTFDGVINVNTDKVKASLRTDSTSPRSEESSKMDSFNQVVLEETPGIPTIPKDMQNTLRKLEEEDCFGTISDVCIPITSDRYADGLNHSIIAALDSPDSSVHEVVIQQLPDGSEIINEGNVFHIQYINADLSDPSTTFVEDSQLQCMD